MNLKVCITILVLTLQSVQCQFPNVANAIFGPSSMVRGVKNLMGGILATDNNHHSCIQRVLCHEMKPEKVEITEEIDPVKRTIVYKRKVIRKAGRLRWIGDIIANLFTKVTDPINRRIFKGAQGKPLYFGLFQKAVNSVTEKAGQIPHDMIHQ